MATIGVVVFCVGEMKHLDRCLKGVHWADDVAIVNLGDANQFANELAGCEQRKQTDWILHIWAEERLDKELEEQLLSLRRIPVDEARSAYKIHVRSYLLGKWVDGSLWGSSPSLRLTRERRRWPAACWNLDARGPSHSASLSGHIRDDSAAELGSAIERMNSLTSSWARELNSRGQAPGLTKASLCSLMVLRRLGASMFRDGFPGLTLSVLCAYATLLVGAKAWEGAKFVDGASTQSMDKPGGPNDA